MESCPRNIQCYKESLHSTCRSNDKISPKMMQKVMHHNTLHHSTMKLITLLHEKIKKKNFISQVFIFLILSYLAVFLLAPFLQSEDPTFGRDLSVLKEDGKERNVFILFAVLLSPIIETFIFQWLVYEQLTAFSFFRKRIYLIVLISGGTFGLVHDFSVEYQLVTFVIGCHLCFMYHYFKTYSKWPFLAVFIVHAIRNLISVVFLI